MQPTPICDSAQLIPHALQELKEAVHYRHLLSQLVAMSSLVFGVAATHLHPACFFWPFRHQIGYC
jgi:hypothetical protein